MQNINQGIEISEFKSCTEKGPSVILVQKITFERMEKSPKRKKKNVFSTAPEIW